MHQNGVNKISGTNSMYIHEREIIVMFYSIIDDIFALVREKTHTLKYHFIKGRAKSMP